MKKNFMVRSPTDSDFHTFNRPGISLLQAAVISRKERHATSDTIVCKFADASVWRFLQCINDEAVVTYVGSLAVEPAITKLGNSTDLTAKQLCRDAIL